MTDTYKNYKIHTFGNLTIVDMFHDGYLLVYMVSCRITMEIRSDILPDFRAATEYGDHGAVGGLAHDGTVTSGALGGGRSRTAGPGARATADQGWRVAR
jgi:hypothetical protein